jgi:hypothetical protein
MYQKHHKFVQHIISALQGILKAFVVFRLYVTILVRQLYQRWRKTLQQKKQTMVVQEKNNFELRLCFFDRTTSVTVEDTRCQEFSILTYYINAIGKQNSELFSFGGNEDLQNAACSLERL